MRTSTFSRASSALIFLVLACAAAAQAQKQDPILRAMHDELDRSKALRVVSSDLPYYIEYQVEDQDSFSVSASLGGLLSSNHTHFRIPETQVRVGSYDFDNTDHVYSGYYSGRRYDPSHWPIDDNYEVMRQFLWLSTDRAYKSAIEGIARKRGSMKNMAVGYEQLPDFSKVPPVTSILPITRHPVDEAQWTNRIVSLSAVFNGYSDIVSSDVELESNQATFYFANSEGTTIRMPDNATYIRVRAAGQAADGMMVHDSAAYQANDLQDLPPEADLLRGVTEVAGNVKALVHAPVGEDYVGPVLVEARAAAQLFAQLLGDNLRIPRRPLADPGRSIPFTPSELEGRTGSRILPEWMDVVDDATQTEWHGQRLSGNYLFDMEGVAPKPVLLVEQGVLKSFLLTRQPVKGFNESNGHARLPGSFGGKTAIIGNLFVKASQTQPLPNLKKKLIELIVQRNKPYGILIRKLDYPSSAPLQELRAIAQASGGSRPVSPPVLVYRVYPDGREELVRGLRFRGLNVRALKDILAASDDESVFNFLNNGMPFAMMGAGGYVAACTVVAPSVLFDELELERPREEQSKPPIVPPPALTAKTSQ
ncbi:MAG TPA: metallopeptidase TldD-related protein [Bryobacteraceae bacterium]|nr:metallopeptidase TldD-related protein [Bryobacteraceae bacterium]